LDRRFKLWGFTKNVRRKRRTDESKSVAPSLIREHPEVSDIEDDQETGVEELDNTKLAFSQAIGTRLDLDIRLILLTHYI